MRISSDDSIGQVGGPDGFRPAPATAMCLEDLSGLVEQLAGLVTGDDAERIDAIAALDRVQAAAAAAQVGQITLFAESQEADQRARGVSARRLGDGVAEQVALARKVSPATGARQVTFARELTGQLPHTFALLAAGHISEWVARLVVRETSVLSRADRRRVDEDLVDQLPTMSPREAEVAARRRGIELDPASAIRRGRTARSDRRVSIRPAPDTMACVTGYVPCEQGIAAWVSLDRDARARRSQGDTRSIGQIMADTFIERLTGQSAAAVVPVEIAITMTADSLLNGEQVPAMLARYGPIPADLARHIAGAPPLDGDGRLVDDEPCERARVFVRRIFTDPIDDTVVSVDTQRRRYDGRVGRVVDYRDQTCRVPYCGAPIRHHDHIERHKDGGPTSVANGQGLCERDNYVKELPGWGVRLLPGGTHRTVITTPTGHRYVSRPPPALGPGANQIATPLSRVERDLAFLVLETVHPAPGS